MGFGAPLAVLPRPPPTRLGRVPSFSFPQRGEG